MLEAMGLNVIASKSPEIASVPTICYPNLSSSSKVIRRERQADR
jgi:hypothetical protein